MCGSRCCSETMKKAMLYTEHHNYSLFLVWFIIEHHFGMRPSATSYTKNIARFISQSSRCSKNGNTIIARVDLQLSPKPKPVKGAEFTPYLYCSIDTLFKFALSAPSWLSRLSWLDLDPLLALLLLLLPLLLMLLLPTAFAWCGRVGWSWDLNPLP